MERPWVILCRVLDAGVPPAGGADAGELPVVIDEDDDEDAQEQEEQHAGVGEAVENVAAVDAAVEAQAQHDVVAEDEAEAQAQEEEHAAVDEAQAEDAAVDEAQAEQDEDAAIEAQIQLEDSVVAVNMNQLVSAFAHLERGADEPDYFPELTVTVAPPPRVSFLSAYPGSHPDPARLDRYPYIIATGSFCLLVHFAIAPSYGTNFNQYPDHSNLVLVRHFLRNDDDGGQIHACAQPVPDRPLGLSNIESVGLVCNQETGDYEIAELIVTTGAAQALVVYFNSDADVWQHNFNVNPLLRVDRRRDWVPHGTVSLNATVLWFDLSWGIISCDLAEPPLQQELNFHRLPPGRVLRAGAGVPDIHCSRCIAVSENLVRYVEIILHYHQAATVNMWYRDVEDNPIGWIWEENYSVSFEDIWADESYAQTGLPQIPPMLVGVSPVNPDVVYFSLDQRLFCVNVPQRRVVHCAQYEPLKRPGPRDEPVTRRYFIPWNLDDDDYAPNVGYQPDKPSVHGDSSPRAPADEGEIDYDTSLAE